MFKSGDIVSHFKREMLSAQDLEREPNMYLYEIVGTAEHTETGEKLMVYRPLFCISVIRGIYRAIKCCEKFSAEKWCKKLQISGKKSGDL